MERAAPPLRSVAAVLITGFVFLILGYLYVYSFTFGYRMVTLVHGAALFFLGCVLFIRHLQSFLLFCMIFCISLQFGYHIVHTPLPDIESQPFMSGISIDSVDVILLLLYAYWGFRVSARLTTTPVTLGHPLGTMMLVWIGYCFAASLLKSRSLYFSLYEVVVLFKGFLVYFYLINNAVTRRDLRVVMYALFATTLAHALYIIFQYVTGLNYTLHGDFQTYVGPEGFRSIGFFGSPDAAASMMSMMLPVGLSYYFFVEERSRRVLIAAWMTLVMAAILCTKVRAAGLAVAISLPSVVVITYLKDRTTGSRVIGVFLGGLLFVLLAFPYILHRFEIGTYGEARLPLVETAWAMFKDHWLMGVGANNYFFFILDYVPPKLRHTWFYIVHNEYLLRLAETGVVGALLYYSLTVALFTRLFRAMRSSDPWIFTVAAGFFSALIASLPHRLFSYYHYVNLFMLFCIILAVAYHLTELDRTSRERETSDALTPELSNSG